MTTVEAEARMDEMLQIHTGLAAQFESRRAWVLAVCECARLSLVHIPEGEDRPRIAIEAAEAWARGRGSVADARAAAHASRSMELRDASTSAANEAAVVAQDIADVVDLGLGSEGVDAIFRVASAAYRAAYTRDSNFASADAAQLAALEQCADIVRSHLPAPFLGGQA